jgi:hypothetical protein
MRELNWKPEQSAELSVLGEAACGGPARIAHILEFSGKRICLATEMKVQSGAAVRLEWDGQLLLGLVADTAPSGFWMEIHHMLLDTGALSWQKKSWQRG